MAVILRNRNFNLKNDLHIKNMPYSEELYEFIIKSRKCHTLYANCEGSYSRRVVNVKDKDTLKNFIYYTLYFDGSNDLENDYDFMKRQHVEDILDKMITTSKNFNFEEEIHFGVVWVYFFLYENKTQKSMPVFKIYEEKSGDKAVVLDVSLILYPTWDDYLDHAEFPLSLLCVPRKGEYCFFGGENEDKILDLEYLCSERLTPRNGNFPNANYVPFSQNAVHPWLIEFKNLTAEKLRKIKQLTYILWHKMKKAKNILYNIAVFAYSMWTKLVECKASYPMIWDCLLRYGLMFLDMHLEDGFWKDLLTPTFFNSITSMHDNVTGIYHESVHLIKLISEKNWREVLKSFCIIFRESENLMVALSCVFSLPPVLNCLFTFFKFSSKIDIFLKSNNNSQEIMKSEELECSTSLQSINRIFNFHSSQNQIYSLETVKSSDRISKSMVEKTIDNMVAEKAIDNMVVDKAVSNLSILETTSAGEVQNQISEESARLPEKLQKNPSQIPPLLSILFLEKEGDHGIFLMQNTSLPYLTHDVSLLIGKEFVFKPVDVFICNVIDKLGNILGTLFFPQEHLAFGLFSLEEIRKKRRGRPLEMIELFPKNT